MNWFIVDKDYVNYLSQFDEKVGFVEYGNRLKLHVGVVFEIENFKYYVPISSAKQKHQHMSNKLDFHKLQNQTTGEIYAVINLNNMIPVPDECLIRLRYDNIENFRSFASENEKYSYIYLLQIEMSIISTIEETLKRKAKRLYEICANGTDERLANRCCNFKVLEQKSLEHI